MSSPRTLIVSDNALAASVISRCLRQASIRDVVGYVDASRACGAVVAELEPDVVIVDETRSREDALARIAEIRFTLRDARIVLLVSEMDHDWLVQATGAGADAAVRRAPDCVSLGALVREVAAGNVFHAFSLAVPAPAQSAMPSPGLTTREVEILRLVAAGWSNGVIGGQLWITEQTVKFHLSNVYRKLGVANRTQASLYAYENGLLELPVAPNIADASASIAA